MPTPQQLLRGTSYLTTYTLLMVFIFLYDKSNLKALAIAQTYSWSIFFIYHQLNALNPNHLAEIVTTQTIWSRACSHATHSFFPFYLKYYQYREGIKLADHVDFLEGILLVLGSLSIWVLWHLICWFFLDSPAYPFLGRLRESGKEIPFYVIGHCGFCLIYFFNFL